MVHRPTDLRLAIVNDYPIVVAGLERALRQQGLGFVMVDESEAHTADVVLFDPFANEHSWDEVAELLASGARVVVFGWETPDKRYADLVDDGLRGFVSKTSTAEELARSVLAVADGETLHPAVVGDDQVVGAWPGQEEGLTAREAEVVAFMAQGMSNEEIAAATFLSINTVKTHIQTVYRKVGVSSRTQAVLWAVDHGLRNSAQAD